MYTVQCSVADFGSGNSNHTRIRQVRQQHSIRTQLRKRNDSGVGEIINKYLGRGSGGGGGGVSRIRIR